jgi:cytochrome c peroxidase
MAHRKLLGGVVFVAALAAGCHNASRSATRRYRTTPLRALWQHAPCFHDGSAPTLGAVVDHYDGPLRLGLSPDDKRDLVEYLKSL